MFARIRSLSFALAALLPVGVLAQAPATGTTAATPTPPVAAVRPQTFH